jgi:DeoR/GlpR family transcriptional regulator of sugar metabolism
VNVDALERLELMRRRLDTGGRIRVADLAVELGVSEMTIRRDLDLLVDEGIAARVRGGAVAVGPQGFEERFRQHARAKARIAEKLLDLVGAGGAIGIDASSTMQRLAARLGGARDVTVLTNGPDVLAVDASKLGHRAPAHGFSWDQVDVLVTELVPGDARLDPYRDRVGLV